MVKYKNIYADKLKINDNDKKLISKIEIFRKKLDYSIKNIDWEGKQIIYQNKKTTIQISIKNKTVTTNIYHPKLGFTSKIRKNCNENDIIGILASPRVHLTKKSKLIKHGNNKKFI